MTPLEQKLITRIVQEGPLTFAAFMDAALYDSEDGYYASGVDRIGREGDFYTSSHLHPVFGAMVGRQILEMWQQMGSPQDFVLIEMGAGEGHLCGDLLDYLVRPGQEQETKEAFYQALRYLILERSEPQRARQQERLKGRQGKVSWIAGLEDAGSVRGCIFSNELLDAFPVHVVRMEESLKEIYVGRDGSGFREEAGPLSSVLIGDYFRDEGVTLPAGYRTEVNLRVRDWLESAAAVLAEGFIFTIDYGYPAEELYSEDRDRGTLLCYFRHSVNENPYEHVGLQDLTSHVNFSSVKRWGEAAGFRTLGYCSQGSFLLSIGIDREIARLAEESDDYFFELSRIKKLFLPQGLGESHKVIIQYRGSGKPKLSGFSMRNQLRFL